MTRPGGSWRASVRAGLRLVGFLLLTVPLMPLQWLFVALDLRWARTFPHWYHRQVCRLLDVRIRTHGALASDQPVLLISNHTSWLDIPVLSAVAPVTFVAKREVGTWPFIASLAKLQRTLFIDRNRRSDVRTTTNGMLSRLATGDTIVLFPEGTTSDGLRVLPFRSSLLSPAKPTKRGKNAEASATTNGNIAVQTCAIAYTHMDGLPLGRAGMPMIAWYGDMGVGEHAWRILQAGTLEVHVALGEPIPLEAFADRKALAEHTEKTIRAQVTAFHRTGGREKSLANSASLLDADEPPLDGAAEPPTGSPQLDAAPQGE